MLLRRCFLSMQCCHEPASGEYCVGLEKFFGRLAIHLRGNNALQIIFKADFIYDGYCSVSAKPQDEVSLKNLVFFSFPVKVYTDCHIRYVEE